MLKYGFETGRCGRIPCPLHNGHDRNFLYSDRHFKCVVCGKSGSVVDFVMVLFDLTFQQAVARLDSDFGLGLADRKPPPRSKVNKLLAERRKLEAKIGALDVECRSLANG